jgi:3-hydroxybutyryl-CoA dehydrogenase
MHISIVGNQEQRKEVEAKFGGGHAYHFSSITGIDFHAGTEVAFDFTLADNPSSLDFYSQVHVPVFADVSFVSLHKLVEAGSQPLQTNLFGFCGLPTLINRSVFEISVYQKHDENIAKRFCEKLATPFAIVKDQPGLITARVIAMIINEAYFSIEDGIASKEDIDLAMKLGTNYPFGPFEWCEKIGKKNIVRLLKTAFEGSCDERYKVCVLLNS